MRALLCSCMLLESILTGCATPRPPQPSQAVSSKIAIPSLPPKAVLPDRPTLPSLGGYLKLSPGKVTVDAGKRGGVFFPAARFEDLLFREELLRAYLDLLEKRIKEIQETSETGSDTSSKRHSPTP
jgi:hypothetical protein